MNCDGMFNELGIIECENINTYPIDRFIFRVYQGKVPELFPPFL